MSPLVALTEQGLGPVYKKLNGNHSGHYAQDPRMVFATQSKAAVCYSFNRGREEGGVFKSLSTTGSRGCNTNWSMTLLALLYDVSEVQRIESVFCVFAILISTSS